MINAHSTPRTKQTLRNTRMRLSYHIERPISDIARPHYLDLISWHDPMKGVKTAIIDTALLLSFYLSMNHQ